MGEGHDRVASVVHEALHPTVQAGDHLHFEPGGAVERLERFERKIFLRRA